MNSAKLIGLVLVGSLAVACGGGGGGGGGGNDGADVGGVWSGAFTLVRNDCNLALPSTGSFTHSVSQNGGAVVLVDSEGVQYLGNVVGDNGFSVDALTQDNVPVDGLTCDTSERIAYDGIDDDNNSSVDDITDEGDDDGDPNTATVKITITRTCNNNTLCESEFRGSATRGVAPGPSPDPSPTPTPSSPIADCEFLTERTYSGDGGCGLNSTSVTIMTAISEQPVITLNPFGVNGATSFVEDITSPTDAPSTRNDLTINGVAGYSCRLECDAPITFDVKCSATGAPSCTERF